MREREEEGAREERKKGGAGREKRWGNRGAVHGGGTSEERSQEWVEIGEGR